MKQASFNIFGSLSEPANTWPYWSKIAMNSLQG